MGSNLLLNLLYMCDIMIYSAKKIFVCGIHGVGKTSFIKNSDSLQAYTKYTCSELIKNYSGQEFKFKKIDNLSNNQDILLDAVNYYVNEEMVLLDGHVVLFNKEKKIEIIDISIFKCLSIEYIIFLQADPKIIFERLVKRDGGTWLTLDLIEEAQNIEREKVIEYSKSLKINCDIYTWDQLESVFNRKVFSFNL